MSDTNHNFNCRYTPEIVSYLYGEIGQSEKSRFESHLANCKNCADELADFSFARFAVKDWRDNEFALLKTPVIEIPFDVKQPNGAVTVISESSLVKLQRIFSLRPVWMASAAALLITVGLLLAASNLIKPDLITDKASNNTDKISNSHTENIVEQSTLALPVERETAKSSVPDTVSVETLLPEKQKPAQKALAAENRQKSAAKIFGGESKIKKAGKTAENIVAPELKDFNKKTTQNATVVNRQIPTLNSFDEVDDNSLRLAELFEDIEAGK